MGVRFPPPAPVLKFLKFEFSVFQEISKLEIPGDILKVANLPQS